MTDLTFFTADLVGFALASALALVVLLAPGALVARLLAKTWPDAGWRDFTPALAIAVYPVIDALAIRLTGIEGATIIRLCLVVAAFATARDMIPVPGRVAAFGIVLWWLYLAVVYVDFDINGGLYQSVTVLDLVKHSAVVSEIAMHGLPLRDPFYARDAVAGYYHYFYDGAAIIEFLGAGIVDSRMAFVGSGFAVGIATASFLRALVVELGWQRATNQRLTAIVVLVCCLGGFDLIGVAFRWFALGKFEQNPEWWDDEISFLPTTASWVPHHLAAVVACFVALLLFAKLLDAHRKRAVIPAMIAGLAMSSAFGLSIWITIGASVICLLSLRFLPRENWRGWIVSLMFAAVCALLLSIPQLRDLVQGRSGGEFPLATWIREPARIGEWIGDPVNPLLALLLAPIVWLVEFGPFAVGAWLFYRQRENFSTEHKFARILIACTVGGLMMNLLLCSAIINNDFGWRVIWFAQLPTMLATIAVLQACPTSQNSRRLLIASLALGMATTVFAAIFARIPVTRLPETSISYINVDPQIDLELRRAYAWANSHIPADALLQHNPASAPRAFAFGLYSRNPVMTADYEADLFGATKDEVRARTYFFGEIFAGIRPVAEANNIHLIVTARDPLWPELSPSTCIYKTQRVCITGSSKP
ncbi:MAG: hypothetical protein IE933_04265 [Sphingomonadales bacterium]|nr:hypothetical protein [Sphingomonadales bacterium]MBD3772835.1 hypothetical protein [Paracoccaceae bacterium]